MVAFTAAVAVLGSVGSLAGLGASYHFHQRSVERQRHNEALLAENRELLEKNNELWEEKRRVGFDDLRDEADVLRATIEREFEPDFIVTPGTRGATVANLMHGVHENVLLYVGIREDLRVGDGLERTPTGYEPLPDTPKYRHYLPESLAAHTDENVLVLDVFTDTGASTITIRDHLLELGYDPENVRRATVACSEQAIEDGNDPDFYSLTVARPFYFPWGKAV